MFPPAVVHEGVWLVLVEPGWGRVRVTLTASRTGSASRPESRGYFASATSPGPLGHVFARRFPVHQIVALKLQLPARPGQAGL